MLKIFPPSFPGSARTIPGPTRVPTRPTRPTRPLGLRALTLAVVTGLATTLTLPAYTLAAPPAAPATHTATAQPALAATPSQWAAQLWAAADQGRPDDFHALLRAVPASLDATDPLRPLIDRYLANIAKREAQRQERLTKIEAEVADALKAADEAAARNDQAASIESTIKALRSVVELTLINKDRDAVLAAPRVQQLTTRAVTAAKDAETRGDWLICSELFALLNVIYDKEATYREDVMRQSHRIAMLRLYVPKRLWELRNQRLAAAGEQPVASYNTAADDFEKRLAEITDDIVVSAISRSSEHVQQIGTRRMMLGGLDALVTMLSTVDLRSTFTGLGDGQQRERMLTAIAAERENLSVMRRDPGPADIERVLARLTRANRESVRLPAEALLHEFGNGAMQQLDEFSQIVWPDEMLRFQRQTQGRFVGVGIQITSTDNFRVKVVTPIDGTPAQRAGVRPGDFIVAVNGQDLVGLALDQVVDLITGPIGTAVTLTIERPQRIAQTGASTGAQAGTPSGAQPATATDAAGDNTAAKPVRFDLELRRDTIRVQSVKGWERTGPGESDYSWFVTPGVGYVRLGQFSENTDREFRDAIASMKKAGPLSGVIVDLRFNPGGYLNQAVNIANRLVSAERGFIVATIAPGQRDPSDQSFVVPNSTLVRGIPVIILVNESSASASEIVAGAVQHYEKNGGVKALILGQRSYGKGSVQTVTALNPRAQLKLTTHYYALPAANDKGFRVIHRKPGDLTWGIEPDLAVDMMPKATTDGLLLRRDADVFFSPEAKNGPSEKVSPTKILEEGFDVQLEAAMLLLKSQQFLGSGPAPTPSDRRAASTEPMR